MRELQPVVRDVLGRDNVGHLATLAPDGAPRSAPLWADVVLEDEHGMQLDRILVLTRTDRPEAADVARDPRVALSASDRDDPHLVCEVRGRVVELIAGDAALVLADRIARKYTGRDFPDRARETIVYVIEADASHYGRLSPEE